MLDIISNNSGSDKEEWRQKFIFFAAPKLIYVLAVAFMLFFVLDGVKDQIAVWIISFVAIGIWIGFFLCNRNRAGVMKKGFLYLCIMAVLLICNCFLIPQYFLHNDNFSVVFFIIYVVSVFFTLSEYAVLMLNVNNILSFLSDVDKELVPMTTGVFVIHILLMLTAYILWKKAAEREDNL